jgi:hypothetical protein
MNRFTAFSMRCFTTLLLITVVAGCGSNGSGGGRSSDVVAPVVNSTNPAGGATAVATNSAIVATFSEAMLPSSVATATFTVTQGATAVPGAVTYSGVTAVFAPATVLAVSTEYTATITTGVKDLAGNALASNYVWTFTTGATADSTAPTVTGTINADGATNVAVNTKVGATFSEWMDPATITAVNFTLKRTGTGAVVAGTVSCSGVNALFIPESPLAAGTGYTVTIKSGASGVKDIAGNSLASDFVIRWTTGVSADTTAPVVNGTINANGATNVAINSHVGATFAEGMDPLSITNVTFTVNETTSGTPVAGTVGYSGTDAVFTPGHGLSASTGYTATIKGGAGGARDLAGNALAADYVWSFTTAAAKDTTPPVVLATLPLDLATAVALSDTASATFSEAMDPLTITTATFTLAGPGVTPVTGTVAYNALAKIATYTPAARFAASTTYTATITTGAKDVAGNPLAADKVWSFTTAAAVVLGPAPVLLGTSGNYVILAKTGVSTVPASAVTGDIGVSPAAATYLTGFSLTMVGTTSAISPQVTGSLYAADMTAPTSTYLTTAVADMGTAYTDAAGRPTPDFLNVGVGEIGGQNLSPGLYKWTTGVTVSADVTLSGGANDVWIFQIPGNLAISPAKNVFLSGGAQAKNIFWQVAGTVIIGTTAHFEGIILSQTSITLETGASMNGRALAQTAVILDASTVTKPN